MNKLIPVTLLLVMLALPVMAVAQEGPPNVNLTKEEAIRILNGIVNWFFAIVLILAVIFLLYAAVLFFFSAGNEDSVADARRAVVWAIVGIAVALLSKGLIILVASLLDIPLA